MSGLLPTSPDTSAAEDADPRVIGVDSEAADDLLAALSSGTARRILAALHEEPAPPSALSDRADTSLQNTQYHLRKLEDAGVVEVIDTVYSEKGREMSVYAPTDRPLVVFAGPTEDAGTLRAALTRLLGAVGVLALVSLLVQAVYGTLPDLASSGDGGEAAADGVEIAAEAARSTAATPTGLPPGLLFFAGGLTVLLVVFGVWYLRRR